MVRNYPSVFVLVLVVIGIVAADWLVLSPYWLLPAAVVFFMAAAYAVSRQRRSTGIALMGLTFCFVSAFQFGLKYNQAGPGDLRTLLKEPILGRVFGRVSDWPRLKPGRTEIVVDLDSLERSDQVGVDRRRVDGSLLLKVSDTTTALQRGDRVSFRARLYPVRERRRAGFDYGRYLNLKGIGAVAYLPTLLSVEVDRRPALGFYAVVDYLRSAVRGSLDRNLSEQAAGLARGFLIGETRDIPPDIYGMFRDSGTLHLLAVSGSNVALVIFFLIWLMRPFWFSPPVRSAILLTVIVIFAGLSYGDPSVVRASIMATLVIGARLLGRTYDLNNIIAATALVILLIEPAQLFDVGFQLSFATAWGLIFITPRLTPLFKRFHDRRWYRWLVFPFLITLVAQICSAPIIAYYFEQIPVVSPVANLIIVPVVSAGVIGVLLLLAADLIWPLAGAFVGSLVDFWLRGVVHILSLFGGENIPVLGTAVLPKGAPGVLLIAFAYLLLILLVLSLTRKQVRRQALLVILMLINVAPAMLLLASFAPPRTTLECHPVPGGVAVLVRDDRRPGSDLILTGLARRSYDLDRSVLIPMLERESVQRLERVFLLSADYDAQDDLLRTVNRFGASHLFVSHSLRGSMGDMTARLGDTAATPLVSFVGDGDTPPAQPGFYPSSDEIRVNLGHTLLVVVQELRTRHFRNVEFGGAVVLVIGSRWSPAANDWIRLHRAGYDRIICARLEQQAESVWPDPETDPDSASPEYITDLFRTGSCRLGLPL